MPEIHDDNLLVEIEAGKFVGITLDTSILRKAGFRFEQTQLSSLRQFRGQPIMVVFSEIVARETIRHLAIELNEKKQKAYDALEKFFLVWRIKAQEKQKIEDFFKNSPDPKSFANALWSEYLKHTGATIINADDHTALKEVLDRYFSEQAPFAETAAKKNEFPDALALVSLEHWAKLKGGALLAISEDKDWIRFAKESAFVFTSSNLIKCLDAFNRSAHSIAVTYFEALSLGPETRVFDFIFTRVEELLADEEIDPEADSDYHFECEHAVANLIKVTFSTLPSVIETSRDTVSLAIETELAYFIEADFSFSATDPVDKDEIRIGTARRMIRDTMIADVIVVVRRDNPLSTSETFVEIGFPPIRSEFGRIGPDWSESDFE